MNLDPVRHRGEGVRLVGTGQVGALDLALTHGGVGLGQISGAGGAATLDDALGNGSKNGMQTHWCRP
ncbi:hypothetical protein D3C84_1092360 [compost metagenome]